MKRLASLVIILCEVIAIQSLQAQQTSKAQQTSADVLTILRASLAAQTGQMTVNDATLAGSADYIAGADEEKVPFAFEGTLSGSTRTAISRSSGTFTEIHVLSSSGPTGTWSEGGEAPHPIAGHNLRTDPAWCFPLFVVERLLSNTAAVVTYIGTENGLAHFQSSQQPPAGTPTALTSLPQHLSQIDLFLDPVSFLPSKLLFNIHPDNNALLDLPVSVQFSNYQAVNGVSLPMHIQRFENNSLVLDIQLQSSVFNSGLSQTEF
jgi:hypothetical protein